MRPGFWRGEGTMGREVGGAAVEKRRTRHCGAMRSCEECRVAWMRGRWVSLCRRFLEKEDICVVKTGKDKIPPGAKMVVMSNLGWTMVLVYLATIF